MSVPGKEFYSSIVAPEPYIHHLECHVHIPESDRFIIERVRHEVARRGGRTVVYDAAGGPARLGPDLLKIPNVELILSDEDPGYISYAKDLLADEAEAGQVEIVQADICSWRPQRRVDVGIAQGVLHHLGKGEGGEAHRFLENMHAILAPDGVFILSDEVLADYPRTSDALLNERYRTIQATSWYSYVIGSALEAAKSAGNQAQTYIDLATDECEIFVDDVYQLKATEEQVRIIKEECPIIRAAALRGDIKLAERLGLALLRSIKESSASGMPAGEGSGLRNDFKDDLPALLESVDPWFKVISFRDEGPLSIIGAMVVLVLQRK